VRKIALGVVAALLLAAFPVALAGTAGADSTAHIRFINAEFSGAPNAIDIYVDGTLLIADLSPGGSFGNWFETNAIGNGQHSLQVCIANGGLPLTSGGLCPANGANPGVPVLPGVAALPQVQFSVVGGNNYTIILGAGVLLSASNVGIAGLFVGLNDSSPTDFGFARITIHNTIPSAGPGTSPFDVCVDGDKVLTGIAAGQSQQVEVEAQQQANVQIFSSAVGCSGPTKIVNLVAGTNLVISLVGNLIPTCTTDCGQVLFVDQERHPNIANDPAFCALIPSLATIQSEFKSTLGGVNPNDHFTFPSSGAVKQLADDINVVINTGDGVVPDDIKPQWEIISAGLRTLRQTFQLVNYDVSGFPVVTANGDHVTLEQIVEAANSFSLPGTADPDLQGAIAALTAWFKANCLPAPTPAAPAAVPASAGPRFTG